MTCFAARIQIDE